MRTIVYSRVELVTYVVGYEPANPKALACALLEDPKVVRHDSKSKPFRSMSDAHVMYVERVGCTAVHLGEGGVIERAKSRAVEVERQHGAVELAFEGKKRRQK